MSDTKRILSYIRRACDDYNMIEEGDKIAIGISGGKDSLTLLTALAEMRRFYPKKYSLCGISIDMGLEGMDFSAVADYCRSLDVEYHIIPSDISKVVFEYRKEHNPCSLCAKMRRGALNSEIAAAGYNKLALGHHMDDVVETFMLSLFYEGRLNTFSPKSYMSRTGITLIRPMIYIEERDIIGYARDLPVVHNPCPANKHTQREYMKQLLRTLSEDNPGLGKKFANAIMHPDRYNLWDKAEK